MNMNRLLGRLSHEFGPFREASIRTKSCRHAGRPLGSFFFSTCRTGFKIQPALKISLKPLRSSSQSYRPFSTTSLRSLFSSPYGKARANPYPTPASRPGPQGTIKRWRDIVNRRFPKDWVVYAIIGLNTLVFGAWTYSQSVYERFGDAKLFQFMYENFTVSWANVTRPWTLLTSCFSHKDSQHILFNMLTMAFLAPSAFSILTVTQSIGLYLTAGLAGSVTYLISKLPTASASDARRHAWGVGASGAIYGVLAFFAGAFPRNTILLFFVLPAPAWLAVGGIMSFDLFYTLAYPDGLYGAAAHLGGAAAGLLYLYRLRKRGVIPRRFY